MPSIALSPVQREYLIQWLNALSDPFTRNDIAQHFRVHPQTAWKWIDQLKQEGFIEPHPFKRGKAHQYVVVTQDGEADPEAAAIQVTIGKDRISLAEFAHVLSRDMSHRDIGYLLHYLYVRSYYADSPDHQHLRGAMPAVDVRSVIAGVQRRLETFLEGIQQLLSYTSPWEEGGTLSRRFGPSPMSLSDAQQMADAVNQQWLTQQTEGEG